VDGRRPPEGKRVVGFAQGADEAAHVDMDDLQLEKTAIHERLHQLSDPRARETLGEKLHEGELGREPNPELPQCYPQERATAQELRKMCGDDAVDRAYFAGDTRELRVCLEHRLGKDNLAKLEDKVDGAALQEHVERDDGE